MSLKRTSLRAALWIPFVALLLGVGIFQWMSLDAAEQVQSSESARIASKPESLHLSWSDDPATSITIQWRTTRPTKNYIPKVWYAPAALNNRAAAMGGQIKSGEAQPIQQHDGRSPLWSVTLTGLKPDTEYRYRAGDFESHDPQSGMFVRPTLSPMSSFRTTPERGSDAPLTFVVAGDSRSGIEGIRHNIERLAKIEADFWLFSGDMTDDGEPQQWQQWFSAMQPVLMTRVLMPVIGNHEREWDLYHELFVLPRYANLPSELQESAWSVDVGRVHLIGLNSLNKKFAKKQVAWLERDLKKASTDPATRWTVVMCHHAVYSSSRHGNTGYLQKYWEPLFDRYGVDLVVTGHDHNYERSHPIRNGKRAIDGKGTVYVVAGGFYAPGYSNGSNWWTATSAHGKLGNYVVVQVQAGELSATAYSGNGEQVLDRFQLRKTLTP